MIRVLVKASSAIAQAGLEALLEGQSGLELLRSPARGNPGIETGDESPPDVLVVEAESLADNAARDAMDWAATGGPAVLLVENPSAEPVPEALRAGVKAVLPSGLEGPKLVAAIEAAALGLVVLHDVEALLPATSSLSRSSGPVEALTPREVEVLQLLGAGLGNKEIASRLAISEHTVKFHVASIMGKLGAASRTEAVTLGIRHGLILI